MNHLNQTIHPLGDAGKDPHYWESEYIEVKFAARLIQNWLDVNEASLLSTGYNDEVMPLALTINDYLLCLI